MISIYRSCLYQRQGRLPWVTSEQDQQVISISKYGMKVTDKKRQRVYGRHALHNIANITYYEDTYGKHTIAVKLGRPGSSNFDFYIYQCMDEVGQHVIYTSGNYSRLSGSHFKIYVTCAWMS